MTHELTTLSRAEQYLSEEPNIAFRDEILCLMAKTNEEAIYQLKDRMTFLRFGTAGLRGKIEAGYSRMNIVSVYRFSFALALELKKVKDKTAKVVIGFDGRKMSQEFAKEVARVLSESSLVYLFKHFIPTPILAYAVKNLSANFGVMITASHNPACDNGIKFFESQSAQAHGEILKTIETNMANAMPRTASLINKSNIQIEPVSSSILTSYFFDLTSTEFFPGNKALSPPIVYTPLHGVGKDIFLQAVGSKFVNDIMIVKSQAEPDEDFPTVAFPNPEEPHALDLAHEFAQENNIIWVFAHDPDADRLQVSVRDENGAYKKLTGNEMGAILAYFAINRAKEQGIKPLVASSIVSSLLTKAMCDKLGAFYVDGLTGFSNIVASALKFEAKNDCSLVFAYEEALGFLIGKIVLDKDGIHAGVRFMEVVRYLKERKKSVFSLLDDLYLNFGLFVGDQWSVRFCENDYGRIDQVLSKFREVDPCQILPNAKKFDLRNKHPGSEYEDMKANVIIFSSSQARVIVRPSGTEKKIKFYIEFFSQATDGIDLANKKLILRQKVVDSRMVINNLIGK